MKRFFAIVLIICLFISIICCGCSKYKCRDEAKKLGESAIFYAEQYIDGVITAEEAEKNISVIFYELSDYCDATHDDTLDSATALCESTLNLEVQNLYLCFINENYDGGKIADIKDEVNDIKETIRY